MEKNNYNEEIDARINGLVNNMRKYNENRKLEIKENNKELTNNSKQIAEIEARIEKIKGYQSRFQENEDMYKQYQQDIKAKEKEVLGLKSKERNLNAKNAKIQRNELAGELKPEIKEFYNQRDEIINELKEKQKNTILEKNNEIKEQEELKERLSKDVEALRKGVESEKLVAERINNTDALQYKMKKLEEKENEYAKVENNIKELKENLESDIDKELAELDSKIEFLKEINIDTVEKKHIISKTESNEKTEKIENKDSEKEEKAEKTENKNPEKEEKAEETENKNPEKEEKTEKTENKEEEDKKEALRKYEKEGYGKNADGEYYNPWTDEYDKNYDPTKDTTYMPKNAENIEQNAENIKQNDENQQQNINEQAQGENKKSKNNAKNKEKDKDIEEIDLDKENAERIAKSNNVKITYIAKEDKYLIENIGLDEILVVSRKSMKAMDLKEIAEKNGQSPENLENVDTNVLRILMSYDHKYGTKKSKEYFEMMTTIGKNKEERQEEMIESEIEISYNLKGLFDKNSDDLEKNEDKFTDEEKQEILAIANNAKKKGIATVKKGAKVTIMEKIFKIANRIKANKIEKIGTGLEVSQSKEQYKESEYNKLVNKDYMKTLESRYKRAVRNPKIVNKIANKMAKKAQEKMMASEEDKEFEELDKALEYKKEKSTNRKAFASKMRAIVNEKKAIEKVEREILTEQEKKKIDEQLQK